MTSGMHTPYSPPLSFFLYSVRRGNPPPPPPPPQTHTHTILTGLHFLYWLTATSHVHFTELLLTNNFSQYSPLLSECVAHSALKQTQT